MLGHWGTDIKIGLQGCEASRLLLQTQGMQGLYRMQDVLSPAKAQSVVKRLGSLCFRKLSRSRAVKARGGRQSKSPESSLSLNLFPNPAPQPPGSPGPFIGAPGTAEG